jgi:anti-sigma factor RsiW
MARLRRIPSCAEVMETLQGYLDGEIEAGEARRVAAHLRACVACDNESAVYLDIKASLARRRRSIDPEVRAALEAFGRDLAGGIADS